MNLKTARGGPRARPPLTTLDKQTLAGLILTAAWCGLFALFPGARGGPLPYFFAGLLITAGLVAAGLRWAPFLGALLCALLLIAMFTLTGYVTYHLTQPQAAFPLFVIVLLFLASALATLGLALYDGAARYLPGRPAASRWLTPAFAALLGALAGAIFIAGIARPSTGASTTAGGAPVVHLAAASFAPDLIAVPRGSRLDVVDDATVLHILTNGSWRQGQPAQSQEPGAPRVANVHVDGGTVTLGPFTQPGTYHIMCIVHPGMDLTVVVP